ncbi:putative lysophospholipase [Leptospira noguchii str. 1993005606]|uniref:Lysophospholipase n=2 Tax=Leptospira noguchii TaxID=28182 RepID=A0ABP2T3W6_9LEPT|nr:alpha/beta fold hydrolase [Leptospira noguchii]EMM98975.1 putative lysophospholipase [Leptospira noguchii str. 2007001578]EMO88664.1 putative lysophospholipase [Leptospira noguchii str. 2001034031]EPE84297.1 putative lysophospholipase [Leptospira noguchii str. 1993005606]
MKREWNQFSVRFMIRKIGITFGVAIVLFVTQSISAAYERTVLTYEVTGRNFYNNNQTTNYRLNVIKYSKTGVIIDPNLKSVLCVHGFGDNSTIYEPLAKELINKGKARNVYILDLPGHGNSTVTQGSASLPKYASDLTLIHYSDALRALLSEMTVTEGKKIHTIVGHSLGGIVIQLVQNQLVTRGWGGNLLSSFGIENTILIASDIPSPLPWYPGDTDMSDPNSAKSLVWNFKVQKVVYFNVYPPEVVYGNFIDSPDDFFIGTKYSVNGVPVSGAPTASEIPLMNNLEPYPAGANVVGLDPSGETTESRPRLSITQNIWNGFNLKVVWLDKDPFFSQSELQGLAQYLKAGLSVITISDPEAVHGTPYSKPSLLVPLF